ncbi:MULTISPECIES: YeiH family protein [Staphylococcus]|uniref:YeiH family protein n=1 Tax=Staphylococcus TaxID=1279 RepID=UPI000F545F40|nr:YeiH family protein [Staphylococcus warneri]MCI2788682.1 YeiH family protein [Staphylococcus warneri]RQM97003.1 putative sulfate exporter family transporter [Staphylococcus warneri]
MIQLKHKYFFIGMLFTFGIAMLSLALSKLPILNHVGGLSIAILIAILYRHFKGYPEQYKVGITFSSKRLLKIAIVFYGLKLNIDEILGRSGPLLLMDACIIIFSIVMTYALSRLFKTDTSITTLLGVGTGICGAAAIAAIAPVIKSRDKDIAISVGIIALVGTVFSLFYTLIYSILQMSPIHFGIWSGTSLHEIAQVVLAGNYAGIDSLKIALLAKLGRVFLLIPVIIIFILCVKYKNKDSEQSHRIDFPYFLIGFIAMALINTYISLPPALLKVLEIMTNIFLLMAMVALGLNVSFKDLKSRALKPLLVIIIVSICLSILSYFITQTIF